MIAISGLVVEPVEDALVLIGRNHLGFGDINAAADRNQQEGVQGIGAEVAHQFQHLGQLGGIVPGDGHVDLHRHAQLFEIPEAVDGGVEGAGNSAEAVVGVGIGAVQRDARRA